MQFLKCQPLKDRKDVNSTSKMIGTNEIAVFDEKLRLGNQELNGVTHKRTICHSLGF